MKVLRKICLTKATYISLYPLTGVGVEWRGEVVYVDFNVLHKQYLTKTTYLSLFSVSATCDHLTGVGVEWRGEVVDVKVLHKQNIPDTFVNHLPKVSTSIYNMAIIMIHNLLVTLSLDL